MKNTESVSSLQPLGTFFLLWWVLQSRILQTSLLPKLSCISEVSVFVCPLLPPTPSSTHTRQVWGKRLGSEWLSVFVVRGSLSLDLRLTHSLTVHQHCGLTALTLYSGKRSTFIEVLKSRQNYMWGRSDIRRYLLRELFFIWSFFCFLRPVMVCSRRVLSAVLVLYIGTRTRALWQTHKHNPSRIWPDLKHWNVWNWITIYNVLFNSSTKIRMVFISQPLPQIKTLKTTFCFVNKQTLIAIKTFDEHEFLSSA